MTTPEKTAEGRQRDAASLRVLGLFFNILGGVVLIATFWTLQHPHAAVVNAASGAVLLAVGVGMLLAAKRLCAPTGDADDGRR